MAAGCGWNNMTVRKCLQIGLTVILYGVAVHSCLLAKETANLTCLQLSEPIDAARAQEIFTQEAELPESVGFCFWGESNSQVVSCKETGVTTEVNTVLIFGNPALLDAGGLSWQEGCYLDEDSAYDLFGTTDCLNQTIIFHDRRYRVLGTIPALQPTMLAVAKETDGALLNRCVLSIPAGQGKQAASQFLIRWGLQGQWMDFYTLWVAVYNSLLILPGILLLRVFYWGIRQVRDGQFSKRIRYSVLSLASAGILILLFNHIIIPDDMIPSRWSDFSFWGDYWDAQLDNLQRILQTPLGERHLQMMVNMVKSILSSMVALLLSLWTFRRQTNADTAD